MSYKQLQLIKRIINIFLKVRLINIDAPRSLLPLQMFYFVLSVFGVSIFFEPGLPYVPASEKQLIYATHITGVYCSPIM